MSEEGEVRSLAVALCAFSILAGAQQNPLAWFPLQVGSRWVYEHEWKSGDRIRPDVDRWTTQETITGLVTIREGLVVLREVRQPGDATQQLQQSTTHRGDLVIRDREPYLVRGNCIYVISHGWDGQERQLRPSYRKYLAAGAVSPDFCFPWQMGRKWGNNDIPWRVEPARGDVGTFLPAEFARAAHLFSSHFGSGGWKDVWFEKGVGVVAEHYIHSGTYDEYTTKLVSFSQH